MLKATRSLCSLLVLSTLSSLLAAQTPTKDQQTPPAHPKEASAKVEPRELRFNVLGLTKDNVAKVKENLQALTMKTFDCQPCEVEQLAAGTCPKCQAPLKPESHALFQKVEPSADSASVALTIEPKAIVKLSELESTLGKDAIKIDATRFPIAGRAHLIVKGATADAAPAIEKALTDAKLFDEVKAKFDTAKNELVVTVKAGASPPSRAKVTTALEGAKAQLGDVIWGPMMPKS